MAEPKKQEIKLEIPIKFEISKPVLTEVKKDEQPKSEAK